MAIKDLLLQHKGNDPVIFNVKNNGSNVKILANSNFWVKTSNELINIINMNYNPNIQVDVYSLDAN
jgi:hypothetical protein